MKRLWVPLVLVAVILFGATLRIARLHTIPPGLFFDEAADLFDITRVLQGWHPLYFPANNGREPIFFYWAALFASLLGVTPYSLRLAAALAGVLALPATFLCAREAYLTWGHNRGRAERAAIVATFVLAITYPAIHFSRFGERTGSLPLFLAITFGLLLRGIRRESPWALTFAGIFGGLSIYTYISSRVAPALLLVPLVSQVGSGRFRRTFVQVAWVAIVWILISVPLGIYAIQHPADIFGHTGDVSLLNPANNGGHPVSAVLHGVVATLGSFTFVGDGKGDQNLPGRPMLDPLLSVAFGIGLLTLMAGVIRGMPPWRSPNGETTTADSERESGWRFRLMVAGILIGWILEQAATSALAVSPPTFGRMTGTLPAVAIVTGLGIDSLVAWLLARGVKRSLTYAAVAIALVISSALTIRDYFFVWGPGPVAYMFMMGHKVDSASYLKQEANIDRVFLAPLYAQDNTIKFLTEGTGIQSFDLGLSLVIPTSRSRDVHYVFPSTEADAAATVARELPSQPTTTDVSDPTGRFPLLIDLTLPVAALPTPPSPIATFEDEIALVPSTVSPAKVAPGGTVDLALVWLDQKPVNEDFTVFVHLRDASNATVTQADSQPGGDSYPTSAWQPGDLVWDHHRITVPSSAHPGQYHFVVGLYRRSTLQRLVAQLPTGRAPSDEVVVGTVDVSSP